MENGNGYSNGHTAVANGVVACPASFHASPPAPMVSSTEATLGRHIARRLVKVGVSDVFAVPGDFNLALLDHLIAEPGLRLVGCCNELNAGYAADGYARAKGVGACAVTFTVGGLSVINAIAGAYSENLPVICIVGGPNSNDHGTNRILHHTIGLPDFSQELRCFQPVTCHQVVINNLDDAHEQIDKAIATALKESKPVYISVACNIPGVSHPAFSHEPIPYCLAVRQSNKMGLEAALQATVDFLNKAVKPVMVAGPESSGGQGRRGVREASRRERVRGGGDAVRERAGGGDAAAVHRDLLGRGEHGLLHGDRGVGGRLPLRRPNLQRLQLGGDFLTELGKRLRKKRNTTAYENYKRIFVPQGQPPESEPGEPLRVNVLFKHIQQMLTGENAVAETGDSWFNCQKLKLPDGCSTDPSGGRSGRCSGYAQGANDKRVIACIGDGSFQVTAQDVSTMLRCGQNSIIFLINNGGYTIEVEIHDGPYNVIKNWNYNGARRRHPQRRGQVLDRQVTCEEELTAAIETATVVKQDCLCFIEVIVHKDDTSKELLEWGSRVSSANSRPPNPQ
ncbi:hypothetical protein ACQ4PT_044021 [Festuca glaucescens]